MSVTFLIVLCPTYLNISSVCLSFICIFLTEGSSAGFERKEACYGSQFRLPFKYIAPVFQGKVYFTPSGEASRKLLVDNRTVSSFRGSHFTNFTMTSTHGKKMERKSNFFLQVKVNQMLYTTEENLHCPE